jgi:putative transposase
MARLPRLSFPGLPVHAVVRGNDRQEIFRSEGDRVFFHRCLVETTRRHGASIHAYVLMSNHVHLLATGNHPDSLARVIQSMGRRYVSYFNYLYDRTGTLWEGRFRSCLVETDRYLLACYRYIEMNPVRAGITQMPGNFAWSSYRFNARGMEDDLVTPHPLYVDLGLNETIRRSAYRKLFECETEQDELSLIRNSLNKGWALGGGVFCSQLEKTSGRRAAPAKRGRKSRGRDEQTQPPEPSAELF